MANPIKVAAFEGGQLRVLAFGDSGREVVLGLPLSRLIVRMIRVPVEEDPVAFSTPVLQALSPFPDEPLTVACETVRESEAGKVVLAVAMPEGATDDLAEALDAQKFQVTRVDALVIGQLRGLWTQLGGGDARRMLAIRSVDGISLVILDGDQPSAIRSIADASEMRREVMLSLLEAEDFGGAHPLEDIVVVSVDGVENLPEIPAGVLEGFGPVRTLEIGSDAALMGVAERSQDPDSLNALPSSWAEMLAESRFKRRLMRQLAVAGGIWLLIMSVLLGVPVIYGFMTDRQKSLSRQHSRQYQAVRNMREKVDLVRKYSNHEKGALETMKRISDALPVQGITLTAWNFKRDDSLRFSGEADAASLVYELKNKLEGQFESVELGGPSAKGNKQKFDITISFQPPEVEQ